MHLYVHVPFCDGKCAYCAFCSVPYAEFKGDAFLDALANELDKSPVNASRNLSTVYFGGGTPSVLTEGQLSRLMTLIRAKCGLANDFEWTVEASPNTLTEDKVSLLVGAGVNRISVGIQTFDDAVLSGLGRRHSSDGARLILKHLVGIEGLAVGCDLIAGLPGVSREQWREDVQTIIDLGLGHVSVYELSIEEGTRFMRMHSKGQLDLPDEDEVFDRINECGQMLMQGGLERYEVSNYAVPGRECRHNLSYWRGSDYLGVGPGASSRLGTLRRTNLQDVEAYTQAADTPREEERTTRDEDLQERLMYHFRLRDGVNLDDYCERAGVSQALRADWEQRLTFLRENGLVSSSGSIYKPTVKGIDFADAICEVLLD